MRERKPSMVCQPVVSVLMPVFNGEAFLRRAVDSVLRQSFGDFELVVIDDGSTDSTKEILNSFEDPRLKVLTNDSNRGISFSRNRAIRESGGGYIAWLDSDDIALENRLQKQVMLMDSNPAVGLCHSNFAEIDEQGNLQKPAWNSKALLPIEWEILWTNPVAQSTVMVRRSLLNGAGSCYNPDCDPAEDYDLWTRLCLLSRFYYLPEVLVQYRTVATSAFHTQHRKAFLKSLESNQRLVESLLKRQAPSFHKHLTTFSGILPAGIGDVDIKNLREWYFSLATALRELHGLSGNEMDLINADISSRVQWLLRNEPRVFYAKGSRAITWKDSPLASMSLEIHWLRRQSRRMVRAMLDSTGMTRFFR